MIRYDRKFDKLTNLDLDNDIIVELAGCYQLEGNNGLVLFEAVIKPEIEKKEIFKKLSMIKVDNPINFNDLQYMINALLAKYKIKVVFTAVPEKGKPNQFSFTGGYNEGSDNITIITNLNLFSYFSYTQFVQEFTSFVLHEIIHRYQFNRIQYEEVRKKLANEKSKRSRDVLSHPGNVEKLKKYLSDKYEVMSYAWQIVDAFRIKGMEDTKIKSILKQNGFIKYEYGGQPLEDYHTVFDISDPVLKRLYKYMHEYLED